MKNLLKATSYTLATALVFILSQSPALAEGTTQNSSTLSFGQVIGGGCSFNSCYPRTNFKEFK